MAAGHPAPPQQQEARAAARTLAPRSQSLPAQQQNTHSSSKEDLELGTKVLCEASFDNGKHIAEVVHKQEFNGSGPSYYVHYVEFDKRLDEWVHGSKVTRLAVAGGAQSLTSLPSFGSDVNGSGGLEVLKTRRQKRAHDEMNHIAPAVDDLAPLDQHLEKEHQEKTKVKNIQVIEMGQFEMDTWYYSPYPEPYSQQNKLYICEFTLKYFAKEKTLLRHMAKNTLKHPPVFEVDGSKHKIYCQNLCLLAKLFLDHKTLYYDVDPFLFYVLCERDDEGFHVVGYFSKEKHSSENYNLACILTLPPHQRKGYGRFLIAFSYELSRKEGRSGTPERPLSDLGMVSYRSYWTRAILEALRGNRHLMSVREISDETGIRTDDVIKTMDFLHLIRYWKGDHILCVGPKVIQEHLDNLAHQKTIFIDTFRLHWTPYTSGQPPKK
ncbi:hypothetical protein WJX74_011001 [Apatococcus lobatus]|uniref:histone acetyltransferase n=1 Tax=Apatococcus lobatus TaxID=904363 RepID=A0AAW1RHR2_9CHLO